jgi:hypothetical protein
MSLDTALRSILDKIYGNQTSGSQKTQIVDSTNTSITQTGGAIDINLKSATITVGGGTPGFAYGDGALTNAYSAVEMTAEVGTDANSVNVPARCNITALDMAFDTIVTCTKVTVYVAEDSAGKYSVSHPVEVAPVIGLTATFGVATVDLSRSYRISAVGTANKLWVIIKTDAGTANLKARLHFSAT